jgi:hypothetical protein
VDALTSENNALRAEVDRLTDLCNKFSAENAALLVSAMFKEYLGPSDFSSHAKITSLVQCFGFSLSLSLFFHSSLFAFCRSDWGNKKEEAMTAMQIFGCFCVSWIAPEHEHEGRLERVLLTIFSLSF